MDGICPGRRGRFRGRSRYGAIIYEAYHVALGGVWQGATQTDGFGVYPVHGRLSPVHWLVSGLLLGASSMGDYYGHYEKKAIRFIRLDLLCGRKGSE